MSLKKIIPFVLSVLFLLCKTHVGYASQQQMLFDQGNQAYQKGDYEGAKKTYEEILKMGYESADLYYNLGNTYFKLGQNANAILFYERALRLRPNDEDIQFNLQIANLSVIDKIPQIPELFYIKYFKKFRSLFSIQALTLITIVLYILFFAVVIGWLLAKNRKLRIVCRNAIFVVLVFLILFSGTFISKVLYFQKNVEAIVISPQVDVMSAPNESSTQIFTIHEGLKVKITDTREQWYEIRLSDGKEGWLKKNTLELI